MQAPVISTKLTGDYLSVECICQTDEAYEEIEANLQFSVQI